MDIKQIIKQAKLTINPEKIKYDEQMKKYTSFKVGGPVDVLIIVDTEKQLQEICNLAKNMNIPIYIIGNGSNILVTDNGIRGIVVKIEIKKTEFQIIDDKKVKVNVGAGNKIIETAYALLKQEITGFEELAGIPGTIGGAVKMNAGAYGKEMKDIVKKVKILNENGEKQILTNEQIQFEYRNSIFSKNNDVILEAELELKQGNKKEIQEKMDTYSKIRKEKQPIEYPSAGSTFKRGDTYITAKLIDEAGLKGYQIGGAQISEKHAGFIINKNNATAKDIIDLIKYTQEKVYEKFGEKIELEVKIIGD